LAEALTGPADLSSNGGPLGAGESVDVVGVTKSFGAKAALSGVHLHIDPGHFPGIAGAFGVRQDHAPALPGRYRTPDRRFDLHQPPLPTGEAREVAGELVSVRLPGPGTAATVTANLPRRPTGNGSLRLFVRPSAVHIVRPEQAQFFAHVRDVAFCGRGYEHALVGDGPLLFTRVFSETRWDRGSAVGVRLSPEGCLVLGAEEGAGGPSEVSGNLGQLSEPLAEEEHAHQ
jgi:TOBE domain